MERLNLPEGSFDGFIFDCDGTLVDSMPLHYDAWRVGLKAAGTRTTLSEDLYYEFAGMSIEAVVAQLNELYDDDIDFRIVTREKEAYFVQHISRLKPIEPVVSILREQAAAGKGIAVASGSQRNTVEMLLEQIRVRDLIPVVVTPADVAEGKPSPDMFLLAAKRIGVEPARCLVFEDGNSGIEAARRAGMQSVFVPSRGLSATAAE